MWLVILRVNARQIIVVAAGGIVVIRGLAAIGVNIEEFRGQSFTTGAVSDDAQFIGAARAPHRLSAAVIDYAQLQKRATKTNAAR